MYSPMIVFLYEDGWKNYLAAPINRVILIFLFLFFILFIYLETSGSTTLLFFFSFFCLYRNTENNIIKTLKMLHRG